jgi:hypothetical protein
MGVVPVLKRVSRMVFTYGSSGFFVIPTSLTSTGSPASGFTATCTARVESRFLRVLGGLATTTGGV